MVVDVSEAIEVRTAAPSDRSAVLELVRAAFSSGGRDGAEEVGIVEDTWSSPDRLEDLELVAVDRGVLTGHVLAAMGDLEGRPVAGIAPLAVVPERHRRGIGSALMAELIRRAEAAGLPLLVLLGNPAYYGRFGFEPAGPLGISYAPVGPDNPAFQARRLAAYDPGLRGVYRYCWETGTG